MLLGWHVTCIKKVNFDVKYFFIMKETLNKKTKKNMFINNVYLTLNLFPSFVLKQKWNMEYYVYLYDSDGYEKKEKKKKRR